MVDECRNKTPAVRGSRLSEFISNALTSSASSVCALSQSGVTMPTPRAVIEPLRGWHGSDGADLGVGVRSAAPPAAAAVAATEEEGDGVGLPAAAAARSMAAVPAAVVAEAAGVVASEVARAVAAVGGVGPQRRDC